MLPFATGNPPSRIQSPYGSVTINTVVLGTINLPMKTQLLVTPKAITRLLQSFPSAMLVVLGNSWLHLMGLCALCCACCAALCAVRFAVPLNLFT